LIARASSGTLCSTGPDRSRSIGLCRWKQEHWEDLWEDLINAEANREDHYMGSVVLESGERKLFRIIDGQQRMATLSILILACVDYL